MDEALENKIKTFLAQKPFREAVNKYKSDQVFDGLTAVCFTDPKSLEIFVMGVVYSTVQHIIQNHGGQITPTVIKEGILMLREYFEKSI